MEVSRIRALRGPNLWSRHTAIEAIVACTDDECNIELMSGFETRLRNLFPEMGFLEADGPQGPSSVAHALELAALGLQACAGCPVTFSRTAPTLEKGVFQVVVEYTEEKSAGWPSTSPSRCSAAADEKLGFDLPMRWPPAGARRGRAPRPSTGSIVQAAVARGIPYRRLTEGSLVQFGWGSKQRRIQAAETDLTSAVAEAIAQDKELTKTLLRAAGVPVPLGRSVTDADDAWLAAREIGGLVVVKPRDGNQGKGVAVKLRTEEEVKAAFRVAAEISDDVMVERYLPGHDYRLLVIGDKLVAAARREPPLVVGDGKRTIRELVEHVNSDPRRGTGHATSLTKIRFDEIALATLANQGFDAESVPPKGKRVILRNNANLSTGGTATDVTDDVHPEVAERAIAAARNIGLDICGVDVVCENVLEPLEAQSGGIVECNAAPGLRMHLQPSYGKGRPVGEAIVGNMFKPGENGRIPVVAVAGTNGKTTTVRLTAHLLGVAGNCVGMTNSDGVYVGKRRIDTGDCSGPRSARNILLHPDVDAAVFETARGGVLREGLAFDRCDVAVVTNIGMGDHLGLSYISTVEDLAVVKRVIVQNVAPHGTAVLNAADPMVVKMAGACPGSVLFFALDPNNHVLATHRVQGRKVVFVDGGDIVAAEGRVPRAAGRHPDHPQRHDLLPGRERDGLHRRGLGAGARRGDHPPGVATFVNDAATAPGRFNVFDYKGATLIADYGHNPDAILALVQAVESMPAKRRSVVISGAGDRRDEDIREQTRILGKVFDDVVLYQDECQRGRADGEVLALLQQGLVDAPRTRDIVEIRGEFLAIDTALGRLQPGDLCLILIDQVEEALEHIAKRIAETQA
jgi:cyanophycin synthetase